MNVSVIIPVKDAPQDLAILLKALSLQSLRPQEIIVIDSSYGDSCIKVSKLFNVKTLKIFPEEFNHGLTRTLAAKKAQGEILVFFTQDARPAHKRALENLLTPLFYDQRLAAVYGRQIAPSKEGILAFWHRFYNYPSRSKIISPDDISSLGLRAIFFSNSFAAYRKKTLQEIGYFPKVPALEDQWAAAKLLLKGYKIGYIARAVVFHAHPFNLKKDFIRYYKCGLFYAQNPWLIKQFTHPHNEGWRYFKSALKWFLKRKKYHLLPPFFWHSLLRLLAFQCGYKKSRFLNFFSFNHEKK